MSGITHFTVCYKICISSTAWSNLSVFIFIIYYKDIINIEWIKNLENWFLKVSFANTVSITNHMDTVQTW